MPVKPYTPPKSTMRDLTARRPSLWDEDSEDPFGIVNVEPIGLQKPDPLSGSMADFFLNDTRTKPADPFEIMTVEPVKRSDKKDELFGIMGGGQNEPDPIIKATPLADDAALRLQQMRENRGAGRKPVGRQAPMPDEVPESEFDIVKAEPIGGPPMKDRILQKDRTVLESTQNIAGDAFNALARGVIFGVPEAIVGLADLASKGKAGKALEGVVDLKKGRESFAKLYPDSTSLQEQKDRFHTEKTFIGKSIAALSSPAMAVDMIAESLAPMFAGGAAGRAAGAIAKIPGLSAAASAKFSAFMARNAGAIGEGTVAAGSAAEGMRQQTATGELTGGQAALAGLSGAGTAVIGAIGRRIAKGLGIEDVDSMVAGASINPEARAGLVKRVLGAVIQEGALEELPQGLQEQLANNIALGKPWTEGMDETAILGFISGAVMGGAVNLPGPIKGTTQAEARLRGLTRMDELRGAPRTPIGARPQTPTVPPVAPAAGPAGPPPAVAPLRPAEEVQQDQAKMYAEIRLLEDRLKDTTSPKAIQAIEQELTGVRRRYEDAYQELDNAGVPSQPMRKMVETQEPAPAPEERKYSSTQFDLPEPIAEKVLAIGRAIPDTDLAENGREASPHLTVKWGLHTEDAEEVRAILAKVKPFTVKLGRTSIFPNGESNSGDVLKANVASGALMNLNAQIAKALEHTDTHPKYQPHVTIAYLKPGKGKAYVNDTSLLGTEILVDQITFSGKDGTTKVSIPLGTEASASDVIGTESSPSAPGPEPVRTETPVIPDSPVVSGGQSGPAPKPYAEMTREEKIAEVKRRADAKAAAAAPPPVVENNGSGESAASVEAINRQKSMKAKGQTYVVYGRDGVRRPLIGPEAVDYAVQKGETYGIEGPDGFQVLDDMGGKVPSQSAPPAATEPEPKAPKEFDISDGATDLSEFEEKPAESAPRTGKVTKLDAESLIRQVGQLSHSDDPADQKAMMAALEELERQGIGLAEIEAMAPKREGQPKELEEVPPPAAEKGPIVLGPVPPKKRKGEYVHYQEVGLNRDGLVIEADPMGVRSYVENGVRQTEPVKMIPSKQGVQIGVDRSRDGYAWNVEEGKETPNQKRHREHDEIRTRAIEAGEPVWQSGQSFAYTDSDGKVQPGTVKSIDLDADTVTAFLPMLGEVGETRTIPMQWIRDYDAEESREFDKRVQRRKDMIDRAGTDEDKALARVIGGDPEWDEFKETGLTDAQLTAKVSDAFGIDGGYGEPGKPYVRHKGGKNPSFIYDEFDRFGQKKVLKGKQLLEAVRRVTGIKDPSADEAATKAAAGKAMVESLGRKPDVAADDTDESVESLLNRYEEGDDDLTIEDVADTLADMDLPDALRDALDAFRDAQAHDRETKGRGDMGDAEDTLVYAMREASKPKAAKSAPDTRATKQAQIDRDRAANKKKRDALIAKAKAKLRNQTNTIGFDEEMIGIVVDIIDTYIKDGILKFKEAALAFQGDFGDGARDMDGAFEAGWELATGEEGNLVEEALAGATLEEETTDGTEGGRDTDAGQLDPDRSGAPEPVRTGGEGALGALPAENGREPEPAEPEGARPADSEGVPPVGVPDRDDAGADPDAPPAASGGVDASAPVPPAGDVSDPGVKPPDYQLTPERIKAIVDRGDAARVDDNIKAIKIVRALHDEKRYATVEEQEELAKYVGWGGLAAYLADHPPYGWNDPNKRRWSQIQDLTTPEQRRQLVHSTLNAHYTYELYVPIWEALQRAGFESGRVLEPSVGTGHAFGAMPADMREASRLNAVELEPITASIAQALYPSSRVQAIGFEEAKITRGTQDLVISNVPFGDYPVVDRSMPKELKGNIHNYFFNKAIDLVRPGGLMLFVTSRYTMDGPESAATRRHLMEKANFIGAIRLPNTAFKEGTSVVTDIIVMQRLTPEQEGQERPQKNDLFLQSPKQPTLSNDVTNIYRSSWYDLNPKLVLGKESNQGKMRARRNLGEIEYTVEPPSDLAPLLTKALAQILPEGSYVPASNAVAAESDVKDSVAYEPVKPGDLMVEDGRVYAVGTDGAKKDVTPMRGAKVDTVAVTRTIGMIGVRDAMRETIALMKDPNASDASIKKAQAALDKTYKRFTKKFGNLNTRDNKRVFQHDPDFNPVMGLELIEPKAEISADKNGKERMKVTYVVTGLAEIFTKRTIKAPVAITSVKTTQDGLLTSLGVKNRIDWRYIAKLVAGDDSKASIDRVQQDILLSGLAFKTPSGAWEIRDEYLSGDVVTKLEDAELAEEEHPGEFTDNIAALKTVQPKHKSIDEIGIRLGAHWVPHEFLAKFIADELDILESQVQIGVVSTSAYVKWDVKIHQGYGNAVAHRLAVNYKEGKKTYTFMDLVMDAVNIATPNISYTVGSGDDKTTVKDPVATLAARGNLELLQQDWVKWVYSNPDAKEEIEKLFNTRYNRTAERKFDGAHMQEVLNNNGLSLPFNMHKHQLNGVYRANVSGNTLLAHEVGAGKTFEMIAIAMEMRRLGRANKPMITVPTYLLGSWKRDILTAYPSAKVLAFDEDDLSADKRQQAMARIAFGDWDIVLVPHSSFQRLSTSDARMVSVLEGFMKELEEAAGVAEGQPNGDKTVKDIAKIRARIKTKIEAIRKKAEKNKDKKGLVWEDLGVDALLVDEAHAFKNLFFYTKANNVRGISRSEADRSLDMFVKVKEINEQSGERNLIFATATPVMNSIVEVYTMQRYLQPSRLRELGVENFDNWYQMFAHAKPTTEQRPDGSYQEVMRVKDFQNLQLLHSSFAEVMDYVTWEDMPYLKLPKTIGGKTQIIQTDPHPIYPQLKQWFKQRIANVKAAPPHMDGDGNYVAPARPHPITGEPTEKPDNHLTIIQDAKKAAIDPRLILGDGVSDYPGSRIQHAAKDIARFYREEKGMKGATLVFLDHGTPKAKELGPLDFMRGVTVDDETGGSLGTENEALEEEETILEEEDEFNLYNSVRAALIQQGIPAKEIAFIHQAKGPAERLALFDAVKSGKVRVLVASTEKGGVGMNVQERLGKLVNLDAPRMGRPGDVRQRLGRAIRQGNLYYEKNGVEVTSYVTKGSTDEWIYSLLGAKADAVSQFMRGQVNTVEEMGDPESFEDAQMMSAGDPRGLELLELKSRLPRMEAQADAEVRAQGAAKHDLYFVQRSLDAATRKAKMADKWMAEHFVSVRGDDFSMTVGQTVYSDRKEATEALIAKLKVISQEKGYQDTHVGSIGGLDIYGKWNGHRIAVEVFLDARPLGMEHLEAGRITIEENKEFGAGHNTALFIANTYAGLEKDVEQVHLAIANLTKQAARWQGVLDRPLEAKPKLDVARDRIKEIETILLSEAAAQDKDLKGAQADDKVEEGDGPPKKPMKILTLPPKKKGVRSANFETEDAAFEDESEANDADGGGFGLGYKPAESATLRGRANVGQPTPQTTILPVEAPEMIRMLVNDLLGKDHLVKVVKGFRRATQLGVFQGQGGIRLTAALFKRGRELELAAVLAHEIGHLIDWLPDMTMKRGNLLGRLMSMQEFLKHTFTDKDGHEIKNGDIRRELKAVTDAWRPWDRKEAKDSYRKYRDSARELYADAISMLLNDPGQLKRLAPTFFEELFVNLDKKPEVRDQYFAMQELMGGDRAELVALRQRSVETGQIEGDVRSIEALKAKLDKRTFRERQRDLWDRFREGFLNKHSPFMKRMAALDKSGIKVPAWADPRNLLSERNYIGGRLKAFVAQEFKPVFDRVMDAGVTWEQFGSLLAYERITQGDRGEIANFDGIAPKDAQELLDALYEGWTPEQRDAVDIAKEELRGAVKEVASQAYSAGLITDATWKDIQDNEAYVTFRSIEHLDKDVSHHIFRQKGSIGRIANPADSSMLKSLATIKAISQNRTKVGAIEFLRRHFPEDIEQSDERWSKDKTSKVPVAPIGDPKKVMVTYYEKGKLRGVNVDPYIAASLENESVGADLINSLPLLRASNNFFRPLFTSANLGFQMANVWRDFWRFWKNMPEMTFGKAWSLYASKEVRELAGVRAFGLADEDTGKLRQAYRKLRGKPGDAPTKAELDAQEKISTLERNQVLSVTFNDLMRSDTREFEQTMREEIFVQYGAMASTLKAGHPLVQFGKNTLDFIVSLGDFIETLPKAAGAVHLAAENAKNSGRSNDVGNLTADQRSLIREAIGSPDYLAGGKFKPVSNSFFLFSNAIIQGWAADLKIATQPKTRSGYWWKTMKLNVAPKLIMIAMPLIAQGLAKAMGGDDEDDDWGKWFDKISEYDKTNYLIVPFPPFYDENGDAVYLRLPQDDAGRVFGGLLWKGRKALMGDAGFMEVVSLLTDYAGGQIPTLAPVIGAASNITQMASGLPVYDKFRNRMLFTQDEQDARQSDPWPAWKKFIGWEFQQLGGSVVWKFVPGEAPPKIESTPRAILGWPLVSSTLGRFIRVSSQGEREQLQDAAAEVKSEEASARLARKKVISQALREALDSDAKPSIPTLARELVDKIYPNDTPAQRKVHLGEMRSRVKLGLARGQDDPTIDALIGATSNAQKLAVLMEASENMSRAEFDDWFKHASGPDGIVSKPLREMVQAELRKQRK